MSRARTGNERFVDIDCRDLAMAPLETLGRLYDRLGWPLTDDTAHAMTRYLADNPRGRHGRHDYDLADFGLRVEEVAERFATYRERFVPDGR
ncbi:MAG: hypothetical protein U5R31_13540 [Acidimicrobiia bacterium]|nr:hypothetical protein [Acidimicrobiia bacterium]